MRRISATVDNSAPVILHVTETFGSGVSSAILSYVENTPEYTHCLLYAVHPDTPLRAEELTRFARVTTMPEGHTARMSAVRREAKLTGATVIHAHSSWAGMYVRTALRRSHSRRIVYTPHCYAFERRDIGALARTMYRAVEWALSFNTTAFAACGAREGALSHWLASRAAVSIVPNVAPSAIASASIGSESIDMSMDSEPVLVGTGRLRAQKDPQFFADAVHELRAAGEEFHAVWIGDGEERYLSALRREGVEVTGWLDPASSQQKLSHATAYLHTARWEGFPLSVLEAAANDIPLIARDIRALRDEGLDRLVTTPSDVVSEWRLLRSPAGHEAAVAVDHRLVARHDNAAQAHGLRRVYAGAASQPADARVDSAPEITRVDAA